MTEATILSFKEIEDRYANEWVLIADTEVAKDFQVIRGEVLAHSPNRDDVYAALNLGKGRSVTIEYIGNPPEDWAVVL